MRERGSSPAEEFAGLSAFRALAYFGANAAFQGWADHFALEYSLFVDQTPVGRTTVAALVMD